MYACEGLHDKCFTATSGGSLYTTFVAVHTVHFIWQKFKPRKPLFPFQFCKNSLGVDITTSLNRQRCARWFSCLSNGAKQGCLYDLSPTNAVTKLNRLAVTPVTQWMSSSINSDFTSRFYLNIHPTHFNLIGCGHHIYATPYSHHLVFNFCGGHNKWQARNIWD